MCECHKGYKKTRTSTGFKFPDWKLTYLQRRQESPKANESSSPYPSCRPNAVNTGAGRHRGGLQRLLMHINGRLLRFHPANQDIFPETAPWHRNCRVHVRGGSLWPWDRHHSGVESQSCTSQKRLASLCTCMARSWGPFPLAFRLFLLLLALRFSGRWRRSGRTGSRTTGGNRSPASPQAWCLLPFLFSLVLGRETLLVRLPCLGATIARRLGNVDLVHAPWDGEIQQAVERAANILPYRQRHLYIGPQVMMKRHPITPQAEARQQHFRPRRVRQRHCALVLEPLCNTCGKCAGSTAVRVYAILTYGMKQWMIHIPEEGHTKLHRQGSNASPDSLGVLDGKHVEDGNFCQPARRKSLSRQQTRQAGRRPCQQLREFIQTARRKQRPGRMSTPPITQCHAIQRAKQRLRGQQPDLPSRTSRIQRDKVAPKPRRGCVASPDPGKQHALQKDEIQKEIPKHFRVVSNVTDNGGGVG